MDPRERADAALARARARGAFVVTPDDAVSPMDAASTVQIPRAVVAEADSTMVIPAATARGQHPAQQGNQYRSGPQRPVPAPGPQPMPQPISQPIPQPGYGSGQHQPVPEPEPDEQPTPRQLDGLVPTTHHPGTQRSLLSRRLDGN